MTEVSAEQSPGADSTRAARWRKIHVAAALLYAFTLPLATAPNNFAYGLLVLCAILRLKRSAKLYRALMNSPVLWLLPAQRQIARPEACPLLRRHEGAGVC